jgi:hypothetical protein
MYYKTRIGLTDQVHDVDDGRNCDGLPDQRIQRLFKQHNVGPVNYKALFDTWKTRSEGTTYPSYSVVQLLKDLSSLANPSKALDRLPCDGHGVVEEI